VIIEPEIPGLPGTDTDGSGGESGGGSSVGSTPGTDPGNGGDGAVIWPPDEGNGSDDGDVLVVGDDEEGTRIYGAESSERCNNKNKDGSCKIEVRRTP